MTAGGGRLHIRVMAPALFAFGAVFGGWSMFTLLGVLSKLPFSRWLLLVAAGLAAVGTAHYLVGNRPVRFAGTGRQANRDLAMSGPMGLVYFGWVLGLGVLTAVSTPLVWSGVALSAANGWQWGAVFGISFGLGRSVIGVAGALTGFAVDPLVVSTFIPMGLARWFRPLGIASSLLMIYASLGRLWH